MLDDNPTTYTAVEYHVGDAYATTWGWNRMGFYVPGTKYTPTAWFDGMYERVGTPVQPYYADYFADRLVTPTDVTIDMVAEEVGTRTYEVTATVCIEAGGVGKTVRLYMVQVQNFYPTVPDYSRNTFRQAAATEDVTLAPGECQDVVRTFTFNTDDWALQENIKIVAWAQRPGVSNGNPWEIYNAAVMHWPFPEPAGVCGDMDGDGDVDLGDFATFAVCYYGSAVTIPPPGCSPEEFADSDCDADGDVDLGDFATFALNYTGAQ